MTSKDRLYSSTVTDKLHVQRELMRNYIHTYIHTYTRIYLLPK